MDTSSDNPGTSPFPQEIMDTIIAYLVEDDLRGSWKYRRVSRKFKEEIEKRSFNGVTITLTIPVSFFFWKSMENKQLKCKLAFVRMSAESGQLMAVFKDDDILKDINAVDEIHLMTVNSRDWVSTEGLGLQDILLKAWKHTVCPRDRLKDSTRHDIVPLNSAKLAKVEISNLTVNFYKGWELELKGAQCRLDRVELAVPVCEFLSTVFKEYKAKHKAGVRIIENPMDSVLDHYIKAFVSKIAQIGTGDCGNERGGGA